MHPHPTRNKAVRPSLFARAKALLTRKPRAASLSKAPAAVASPSAVAVNGHVSVEFIERSRGEEVAQTLAANLRTAASAVEAIGTADRLLQELRNAPSPRREDKAREVCAALQATLGHDPSMANFRNESDPAKRAEIAMKILTARDKPESMLRHLLASFHSAPTAAERAALFPAVQLAAKKAGLLC